jgi:choline-sulfatase
MSGMRNLVVVVSDEHRASHMGAYGNRHVRTPNLDRIAAQGRRYRFAVTPSPICVPARAAMATGLYPHRTGYWDNAMAYDGRVPTWGHALRAAGVQVESIGKLHYCDAEADTGFARQHLPMHVTGGTGMIWGSVRDPLPELPHRDRPRMIGDYVGPGETDYSRYDAAVTERTEAWLHARHPEDAPWVLFVGLVSPHFPLVAPERFAALYPPGSLPAPALRPEAGYRRHPWVQAMHDFHPHDADFRDAGERAEAVRMYHALCSYLDENVGRIHRALHEAGLGETTGFVYTSDHGDNLGDRGLWGKSTLYDGSVAVPFVMTGPGVTPGRVEDGPVSLIDLYPTILDVAGVTPPADRAGLSLLPDNAVPRDRAVFSEYHAVGAVSGAFMIRKGRWKYNHYVGFAPELFDMQTDPGETRDLAADPARAGTIAELHAELLAICEPEDVDARAKADQAALIERHGGREAALGLGNTGATPTPLGGGE